MKKNETIVTEKGIKEIYRFVGCHKQFYLDKSNWKKEKIKRNISDWWGSETESKNEIEAVVNYILKNKKDIMKSLLKTNEQIIDEAEKKAHEDNKIVEKRLAEILEYKNDEKKEDRLKQNLCKNCYYFRGRIVGHAFTTTNCEKCGREMTFPNTGVDKFCGLCAERMNICKHCGAYNEN